MIKSPIEIITEIINRWEKDADELAMFKNIKIEFGQNDLADKYRIEESVKRNLANELRAEFGIKKK